MDADAGENGHVVYALEPETRSSSLFRIDPGTGSILLVDELPVNDVNTTYHVTVIARDAGLPVKSSALRVTVMVSMLSPQICIKYSRFITCQSHTSKRRGHDRLPN